MEQARYEAWFQEARALVEKRLAEYALPEYPAKQRKFLEDVLRGVEE